MARTKSSKAWLKEHVNDRFVKQAKKIGYRSRAAFKLLAVQEKYSLVRSGMFVLDMGAAPGGWAQLATGWVGETGRVIAVDVLPMAPLSGVRFIEGDITQDLVLQQVKLALAPKNAADIILSDMAPNLSGISGADQARSIALVECVIEVAAEILAPEGKLLVKVFQGAGFDAVLNQLRQQYKKVQSVKPPASRQRSREMYFLAWK